jgi:hypothetical protein
VGSTPLFDFFLSGQLRTDNSAALMAHQQEAIGPLQGQLLMGFLLTKLARRVEGTSRKKRVQSSALVAHPLKTGSYAAQGVIGDYCRF